MSLRPMLACCQEFHSAHESRIGCCFGRGCGPSAIRRSAEGRKPASHPLDAEKCDLQVS